jgi:hypothetical protein
MKTVLKTYIAAAALGLSLCAHDGLAASIFVTETGPVTLRYIDYEAAYTNTLSLHSPLHSGAIFVNKTTPFGSIFELGTFDAGTPLVFSIFVHDTGFTFFSGDAASNPDNTLHASMGFVSGGLGPLSVTEALVGFEDLWNGGDLDYNDLRFAVSNVGSFRVPEPSSPALLISALIAGLVSRMRSRA